MMYNNIPDLGRAFTILLVFAFLGFASIAYFLWRVAWWLVEHIRVV